MIVPVTVPKWGMAMEEGLVVAWLVGEGDSVEAGQEILELESTKIAAAIEAKSAGILRRQIAQPGQTLPVGALLGVIADSTVDEAAIEAFISEHATAAGSQDGQADWLRTRKVVTSGGELHFTVEGQGDRAPVVLLHGLGGDSGIWSLVQSALASDREVFAVDLPGHGGSTRNLVDPGIDGLSVAVIDFLLSEVGRPAHLVGHSLGGGVAQAVAVRRPDLVASLVLVAPVGLGSEINGAFLEAFVGATSRRQLRDALGVLFADPSAISAQMLEEMLRDRRIDGATAALTSISTANFDGSLQRLRQAETTAALGLPVLLIWGIEDRVIPPSHSTAVADARVVLVSGAGHMPMVERPQEVSQGIIEFMAEQ